jgi:hypothetical protein
MNSTALTLLSAHPLLSLVFGAIVLIGAIKIARAAITAGIATVAARHARRLRATRALAPTTAKAIYALM